MEEDAKKRELKKKMEEAETGVTEKVQSKQNYLWLLILLPVLAILAGRFLLH